MSMPAGETRVEATGTTTTTTTVTGQADRDGLAARSAMARSVARASSATGGPWAARLLAVSNNKDPAGRAQDQTGLAMPSATTTAAAAAAAVGAAGRDPTSVGTVRIADARDAARRARAICRTTGERSEREDDG